MGGRIDVAVSQRRTDPWSLHVPQAGRDASVGEDAARG
jgi:hypothetical protein